VWLLVESVNHSIGTIVSTYDSVIVLTYRFIIRKRASRIFIINTTVITSIVAVAHRAHRDEFFLDTNMLTPTLASSHYDNHSQFVVSMPRPAFPEMKRGCTIVGRKATG